MIKIIILNMANRNWLITRNNPDDFAEAYLERMHNATKARYTVG